MIDDRKTFVLFFFFGPTSNVVRFVLRQVRTRLKLPFSVDSTTTSLLLTFLHYHIPSYLYKQQEHRSS